MTRLWLLSPIVVLAACGAGDDAGSTVDVDELPDTHDALDASEVAETADEVSNQTNCEQNAAGAFPDDVVWITLDGLSDATFSLASDPLPTDYTTDSGIYDLNRVAVFGANGFRVDVPGRVLGARARFEVPYGEPQPVELVAWPDFSSDGYVFDVDSPLGRYTRCLQTDDTAEWVDFVFEEPVVLDQPGLVFVGYERAELGEGEAHPAELMMENHQQEAEPYFSGIRWPTVDPEQFWGGQVSPWYSWQVRVAFVPEPRVEPGATRFERVAGVELGARVAWADYNNDGWYDVMTSGPRLWRNNEGVLSDASAEALPPSIVSTSGGLWGDLNNDGCVDYVGQGGVELVLQNQCDGTFVDRTAGSGLDDTTDARDCNDDGELEPSPTEGLALFDFDGDGLLDVYLANYECGSGTEAYRNYPDRLFRNTGEFIFVDVSDQFDIDPDLHAGRGATPIDFDFDGDVDLYVSNYRLDPNFLFENHRGGLREIARERGVQGRRTGSAYAHTIGSVFGDIDGDGDLDLVNGNLAHPFYFQFSEPTTVLVNDGFGVFADEAADRGIIYRETHSNPVLFDADNDGDLDLFITAVYASRDSDFYQNDGDGFFALQNHESGLVVRNGWGAAAADIDRDGDIDIAAGGLFTNRSAPSPAIEVRAWSRTLRRDMLGATVRLYAGERVDVRTISGGSGTTSQDAPAAHFGLDGIGEIDRLTVLFPGGETVEVAVVPASGRLWVFDDGTSSTGWMLPAP